MTTESLIFTLDALKAALTEMAPDQPAVIEQMISNRGLNRNYLWVWAAMLLEEAEFSIEATGHDLAEVAAAHDYAKKLRDIHARIKTASATNDPMATGQIDCKRLYIPGATIKAPCPECGEPCERDLGFDYVSYPDLGKGAKPSSVYMYCEKCSHEDWEVPVQVKLTVELDMMAPEVPADLNK